MARFGKTSLKNLASIDSKLQDILNEAIKETDFSVIFGNRSPKEQFELYKKGREEKEGKWVKVGKTVTNCDGYKIKSNHNYMPSKAVDLAPFPIDWNNIDRFIELSKIVKRIAEDKNINIRWGGDWVSFKDYPHYEIV